MANSDKRKVTAEDLESLIELFNRSGWDEMHLEAEGIEIFLSNDPNALVPRQAGGAAVATVAAAPTQLLTTTQAPAVVDSAGPTDQAPIPDGQVAIRAPNLGTFYRAPKPGAPPYIEIGQQVEIISEVCLIEVMKLFTPVQGNVRGIVREIRARDGQMVEFDDVLIIIEPN
jgi:acetyl-CoA carboxylase biotin carboxyl carrier protein